MVVSGFKMWNVGVSWTFCSPTESDGACDISRIERAAMSTGSQDRDSFFSIGRLPVTLTLLSINGHASVMLQIPFSVSPHSWPIRRTAMLPCSLVRLKA